MAFKLPNIKGDMDRKYGHGDYARGGKKFEERMKPGESKFNYDVRMRKQASRRAIETDIETHDPKSEIKGDFSTAETLKYDFGTEAPVHPSDLRSQENLNFGITSGMTFGEAFAQAGKRGARVGTDPFFWTNPKTGETKSFLYDFAKQEDKEDATDIDMDKIPDYIQGTTRYHK